MTPENTYQPPILVSSLGRHRYFPIWVMVFVAMAFFSACQEKKSRSLVIRPQVTVDSTAMVFRKLPTVELSPKTSIVDSFFTSIKNRNNFNGVVLVADQGKVIYRKSFGFNDLSKKDTLNPFSIFQVSSVSMQFTSIAILKLMEEEKLRLDDPVKRFFPEFPYNTITIRYLLSHRTGLPNYVYFGEEFVKDKSSVMTNSRLMELLSIHKPKLYFEPDQKFNYCNTNYCILASIIEKVSGLSYSDYMHKRIFEPLGMDGSFVGSPYTAYQKKLLVKGYDENNKEPGSDYLDGLYGDKGIFSSAIDLFKWETALSDGKLINPSTLSLAMKPANRDMLGGRNYGFGWRIKNLPDGSPVYYHGGWWKGFNTFVMRNPVDRSSIIILSNHVNGSFNNIISFIPVFYNQKAVQKAEAI